MPLLVLMKVTKIILLLPLIATTFASLGEEEDGTPKCVKVDECSCRLKNTGNNGLIDLYVPRSLKVNTNQDLPTIVCRLDYYYNCRTQQ